jgi:hypothetical protein
MPTFLTRPVRVEAYRWGGNPYNYEYWLFGALNTRNNQLFGKIQEVNGKAQVVTPNGTQIAEKGDWIVWYNTTSKHLEVFKPDEFDRKFDKDQRRAKFRSTKEEERQPRRSTPMKVSWDV